MPKRNKVISRLVLPLAIFLWLIGWSLLMLGSKMETKRNMALLHPKSSREKEVTLIMPVPEQKITA
jgi:hypothetical protein